MCPTNDECTDLSLLSVTDIADEEILIIDDDDTITIPVEEEETIEEVEEVVIKPIRLGWDYPCQMCDGARIIVYHCEDEVHHTADQAYNGNVMEFQCGEIVCPHCGKHLILRHKVDGSHRV